MPKSPEQPKPEVSREIYEDAKRRLELDEVALKYVTGGIDPNMLMDAMRGNDSATNEARLKIYYSMRFAQESRRKLEELMAGGQEEAIALHEEYERLRTQAQEAIKALADFEREKLDMHKEEPDASSGENVDKES